MFISSSNMLSCSTIGTFDPLIAAVSHFLVLGYLENRAIK